MPELPEVENYRQLLVPLISPHHSLRLERHTLDRAPPRKFLSDDQIEEINRNSYVVTDVVRKGKLICFILMGVDEKGEVEHEKKDKKKTKKKNDTDPSHHHHQPRYLFVHMGMTGRISTPHHIPKLVEVADTITYPPSHTYLRFVVEDRRGGTAAHPGHTGEVVAEACFSDPRKFGSILLKDTMEEDFDCLAPDAWLSLGSSGGDRREGRRNNGTDNDTDLRRQLEQKVVNQSMGIKALLLDQKRVVSGVGNWVADEVLYQCQLHPDQNYLTNGQAHQLMERLGRILDTAVHCLTIKQEEFPSDWLFHYRWSKGRTSSSASKTKNEKKKKKKNDDDCGGGGADDTVVEVGKDAKGRTITFVTSGGRTSAIIPTIQKKKSQKPTSSSSSSSSPSKKSKPPSKGVTADVVASIVTTTTLSDDIQTTITTSISAIGIDQKKTGTASGSRKRKMQPTIAEKDGGDTLPKKEKAQPVRTAVVGSRRSSRLSSTA